MVYNETNLNISGISHINLVSNGAFEGVIYAFIKRLFLYNHCHPHANGLGE